MSKKTRKNKIKARDAPEQMRSRLYLTSCDGWEELICSGYKPLTSCAEVQTAIGVYASLVASMTIQLMRNTPNGDERVKNGLSRKLDIDPHPLMTHQTWMTNLVRVMMTEGNQVTLPIMTSDGMIDRLKPLAPSKTTLVETGEESYIIVYEGKTFAPDEVLHFPLNPDPEKPWIGQGFKVTLKDVVDSLRQTMTTKNALMKSPAPSVIVKVDGLMEDLQGEEGREKLRTQYLSASETGKPWLIPAEAFEVTQVKPLTLNDLAIQASLELDKRSAAAIMGVPAFLMGVGTFDEVEFNWFVATRVMDIARVVEQELTKKLLIAPDMYFHMNNRSLLNYNLDKVVSAGSAMVDRIAMRRNEWRDWAGLPPDPEMNDLLALENYIPADKLGEQKKLGGPGGENNENQS